MTKPFLEAGVDGSLASRCGTMRVFYSGLDIVEVAINANMDVLEAGRIYFRTIRYESRIIFMILFQAASRRPRDEHGKSRESGGGYHVSRVFGPDD